MNNLANLAAFPRPTVNNGEQCLDPGASGMTYRQWLAGEQMKGLIAFHGRYWQCEGAGENLSGLLPEDAAKTALQFADALISELQKKP